MIYFTGIGSRDIDELDTYKITKVSEYLNTFPDITVISGNANGADIEWQKHNNHVSILPWNDFNFVSFIPNKYYVLSYNDSNAFKSVDIFHPNPKALTNIAEKLMARNYLQICPKFLNIKMVNFVIYLANEDNKGNVSGGTGQAVRIAKYKNVPVYNLRTGTIDECIQFIKKNI